MLWCRNPRKHNCTFCWPAAADLWRWLRRQSKATEEVLSNSRNTTKHCIAVLTGIICVKLWAPCGVAAKGYLGDHGGWWKALWTPSNSKLRWCQKYTVYHYECGEKMSWQMVQQTKSHKEANWLDWTCLEIKVDFYRNMTICSLWKPMTQFIH